MLPPFDTRMLKACLLMQLLTDEFRKIEFEFTTKEMDSMILSLGEDEVKYFLNFFKKLTERIKDYYPH